MDKFDLETVRKTIADSSQETKIYIGTDSERFRKGGVWYADFTTAIVIHRDGNKGAQVFGEVVRERDWDQRKDRPANRLMSEVYKASEMYLKLQDVIGDRYFEVHLDINPDEKHGSSCVIGQAIGYIKGTCMITPKVKPEAFAASYAADRLKDILDDIKRKSRPKEEAVD
jgi:predicted RNase H-related nuclease YkuK (DUF458 family)